MGFKILKNNDKYSYYDDQGTHLGREIYYRFSLFLLNVLTTSALLGVAKYLFDASVLRSPNSNNPSGFWFLFFVSVVVMTIRFLNTISYFKEFKESQKEFNLAKISCVDMIRQDQIKSENHLNTLRNLVENKKIETEMNFKTV
jgi:hypothetical protein